MSMEKKFVAVLDKSYDVNVLLVALGHISSGLAGTNNTQNVMSFVCYNDVEGNIYPNISDYPFIVLKGNQNKIKSFRENLIQEGLPYSCFLDTMLSGGTELQKKNTTKMKAEELKILAIASFGEKNILDILTKKFSLWK